MSEYTEGLPGMLTLRAGQVVRFALIGAGGAGNRWSSRVDGEAVRAHIEVAPPPPPSGPTPSSSSAAETLVVAARQPGTVDLVLRLGRSWSPESLAEHRIRVTVD